MYSGYSMKTNYLRRIISVPCEGHMARGVWTSFEQGHKNRKSISRLKVPKLWYRTCVREGDVENAVLRTGRSCGYICTWPDVQTQILPPHRFVLHTDMRTCLPTMSRGTLFLYMESKISSRTVFRTENILTFRSCYMCASPNSVF
jgi:hypothetical protein